MKRRGGVTNGTPTLLPEPIVEWLRGAPAIAQTRAAPILEQRVNGARACIDAPAKLERPGRFWLMRFRWANAHVGDDHRDLAMIDNAGQSESEFTLFGRLTRALSHVARGDLSVITNEVSYLATRLPAAELGRARNRCAQMAATIAMIAGIHEEVSASPVDWRNVVGIFGVASQPHDVAGEVSIDRIKIERLASILRQMLPGEDREWQGEVRRTSSGDRLVLTKIVSQNQGQSSHYFSWSGFAAKELGERSVIDGVVADLITRAHGWRVSISTSQEHAEFHLHIPITTKIGTGSFES